MTGTVREMLITEALGDLAALIERVEALGPAMEDTHRALIKVRVDLTESIEPFQARLVAIARHVQVKAVEQIIKHSNAAAHDTVEAQTAAMSQAAREIFDREVAATLRRLQLSLECAAEQANRPWTLWMTHTATAAVSATVTAVVMQLLVR